MIRKVISYLFLLIVTVSVCGCNASELSINELKASVQVAELENRLTEYDTTILHAQAYESYILDYILGEREDIAKLEPYCTSESLIFDHAKFFLDNMVMNINQIITVDDKHFKTEQDFKNHIRDNTTVYYFSTPNGITEQYFVLYIQNNIYKLSVKWLQEAIVNIDVNYN